MMKIADMKDLIELSVIVLVALFSIFGIQTTSSAVQQIIIIIFGVVLLLFGLYKGFKYVRASHREVRSMSNINVIKKSRLHCQSLYKFAQVSRKKLEKNKDISFIKQSRLEEDKILEIIKGTNKSEERTRFIQSRIDQLQKNYSDKNTVTLLKSLDNDEDYRISRLISETFVNLERVLLNAEQYDLRIKFGKYILDFSDSELKRQRASIDFLGWTYLMMGEINKGEKAIELGIERANLTIKKSIDEKTVRDSYYNIIRGYRHMGSARYTYENHPDKALQYLYKGKEYFLKIDDNDYQKEEQEKLKEMIVGIDYGIAIATFYQFKKKLDKKQQTDDDYKRFEKMYDELTTLRDEALSFKNKHRFIKIQILRSKYLELIMDHQVYFVPYLSKELHKNPKLVLEEIKGSLDSVDKIFKTNVFTDEAVELFLEESVKLLKYNLVSHLRKEA